MAPDPLALPRTSVPAARALEAAGIRDLQDLAGRTEREVAALHGIGPKAIRVYKAALAAVGLAFREAPPAR